MTEPPARPEPTRPAGYVRKVMAVTVLGALVLAATSIYGDVRQLAANLRAFDWTMMVIALLLACGNYVLRAVRFDYYLRLIGLRYSMLETHLVFYSGFIMSITPGKLGEVFKSALLYETHRAPIEKTAPLVVAERLTDLLALLLLTSFGALYFPEGVPIAIFGAGVVGLALIACMVPQVGELFLRLAEKLPVIKRVAPKLRAAYETLRSTTKPVPLLLGTVIGLIGWGLEIVAFHLIILGFPGESAPLEASSFIYSGSTIAGALAMMPGGLGVTEAGMTGLLVTLVPSIEPSVASAVTILTRLATLWWAVLVGAISLALHRRLSARFMTPP